MLWWQVIINGRWIEQRLRVFEAENNIGYVEKGQVLQDIVPEALSPLPHPATALIQAPSCTWFSILIYDLYYHQLIPEFWFCHFFV